MLNGDSFFDIDLAAFAGAARAGRGETTIALRHVEDTARYGSVTLEGERIIRFVEKQKAAGPGPINAGIYVVPAEIVETITALPCSIEADIFPRLAREGRLFGTICSGYFIDIGLPETLNQARLELAAMVGDGAKAATR
jgi:D-glycero-D-manno-heptose 1,7-bisphosphate phosphatase